MLESGREYSPRPVEPIPVVPLEPSEGVGASPPPLPTATTPAGLGLPRFCNHCGTPWDPLWAQCPYCAPADAIIIGDTGPALGVVGRPIASALGLYFTILATLLIGLIAVTAVGPDTPQAVNIEITISVIDAVIIAAWCIRSRKSPDMLPLRNPGEPKWHAVALASVPVTFGLATLTVMALTSLFDVPQIFIVDPVLNAGYGWTTIILLVCVQPAIFEELAFRGIVLGGMRQLLPDREAIIVSALMFMIIHLQLLSFPHLVLIGLVLGYVRVKSGSLYPCMLMHFCHNLAVVLTERWST